MKKLLGILMVATILLFTGCDKKPADLSNKELKSLQKMAKTANIRTLKEKYKDFVFNDKNYRAQIIGEKLSEKYKKKVYDTKQKIIDGVQQIIQKAKNGEITKSQLEMLAFTGQLQMLSQVKEVKEKYLPELQKLMK